MSKGMKVFLGIMGTLVILSGVVLLIFGNKKTATPAAKNSQTSSVTPPIKNSTVTQSSQEGLPTVQSVPSTQKVQSTQVVASSPSNNVAKKKLPNTTTQNKNVLMNSQWTQCKAGIFSKTTNLFWKVQIAEGIPIGGTYAKGFLNGAFSLPVQVIIKSDSKIIEKIKTMLVAGKTATLRGNCTGVAADGAVVIQVF